MLQYNLSSMSESSSPPERPCFLFLQGRERDHKSNTYVRGFIPLARRLIFVGHTMLLCRTANLLAVAALTLLRTSLLPSAFGFSSLHSLGTRRSAAESHHRPTNVLFMSADVPSKADLDAILEVAIDASKKAGEIIIGNSGPTEVTKTKANSKDLLTLIDPLCEKTIKDTVVESFPDHDFLGEEDVPPGKEASAAALDALLEKSNDWLWIVDPSECNLWKIHSLTHKIYVLRVSYSHYLYK